MYFDFNDIREDARRICIVLITAILLDIIFLSPEDNSLQIGVIAACVIILMISYIRRERNE